MTLQYPCGATPQPSREGRGRQESRMDKQQQDDRTTAELIRARDEGAILSRIDSLTEKLRKKRTDIGSGNPS